MKWDAAVSGVDRELVEELAASLDINRNLPLVVAGSTAPGEHELLLQAVQQARRELGVQVQLLCAPRRPEWFAQAGEVLAGCVQRSAPGRGDCERGRFLLDTIGELRQAYALADLVVVGRSFGELHGSDPMEPAALGKPILIGPATADFAEATQTLAEAGGLLQVAAAELATIMVKLLGDDARRREMGEAGRRCVEAHRGAAARQAEMLLGLLHSDREG